MTGPPVLGRFDPELFARFRAAPEGSLRRALHSRLVIENEPLVKVLVAQLLGRDTTVKPRRGKRTKLACCRTPELMDWDDAMQAGRIGMAKALDRFDPAQGKLSLYALHKIRYELQCVEGRNAVIHVPRGREADAPKGFDFIEDIGGEEAIEDRWERPDEEIGERDFNPANDVDRVGSFPISPPSIEVAKPDTIEPLAQFVRDRCALTAAGRAPQWDLWNAYTLHHRRLGAPTLVRKALVLTMCEKYGLREVWIRTDESPSTRALAGIRVQYAA